MLDSQQSGQASLAVLNRLASYVLTVDLKQVERAEGRAPVASVATDQVEYRKAVFIANDGLAIDNARSHWQRLNSFGGEREAVRQVVTIASDKAHGAPLSMS